MENGISPLSAEGWIIDMFSSRAAASGGVIRRKKRDIERYVGMTEFTQELQRRGFQAIENAGQIVIFCNHDTIRQIL
ncbi:MAG: N-(5'-phosphoribosyl)anthranilate isomerase [Pseudomonadota bacterium]